MAPPDPSPLYGWFSDSFPLREHFVLGEDVVAERDLVEQVRLGQLLVLAEPAQEKEQLALEGRPGLVLVEVAQEGVVDLFLDGLRVEPLGLRRLLKSSPYI